MASRPGIGRLFGKRIGSSGRTFLGTAFLASNDLVITCFHCIGNSSNRAISFTNLELVIDRDVIRLEPHCGDPVLDFHVLKVIDPVPSDVAPIPLSAADPSSLPFRAVGYPAAVAGPDSMAIDGDITSQSSNLFGSSAIQLFSKQAAAGLQLNGMSGAPVLVGRPEAAIGCIRWNPVNSQNPNMAVGGIVFACPAAQMIHVCKDLAKCEIRQARMSSVALNPATLPALQHQYASLPRPSQLQKPLDFEWRGVPVLEYSTPRQLSIRDSVQHGLWREVLRRFIPSSLRDTSDRDAKLLGVGTKHLLDLAAVGAAALAPSGTGPFATVLLVRASLDTDRFNYELISPHAELAAFIQDHLPPRMAALDSKKTVQNSAMSLQWKGGVPIGALFPVVLLCDHGRKRVLITNENQLSNPSQFLNPHNCDTTSGFLNFVGTFSYLTARYPSNTAVVEFSNIEKAFENPKIKAWQNWLFQFMDTAVIFDPSRLYVRCDNPEEYSYFLSARLSDDAAPTA